MARYNGRYQQVRGSSSSDWDGVIMGIVWTMLVVLGVMSMACLVFVGVFITFFFMKQ